LPIAHESLLLARIRSHRCLNSPIISTSEPSLDFYRRAHFCQNMQNPERIIKVRNWAIAMEAGFLSRVSKCYLN
jgi:hypothetical protein